MEIQKIIDTISTGDVLLCPSCRGIGEIPDMSWGSGASDKVRCPLCEGSGLVQEKIVKALTYASYKNKNS